MTLPGLPQRDRFNRELDATEQRILKKMAEVQKTPFPIVEEKVPEEGRPPSEEMSQSVPPEEATQE